MTKQDVLDKLKVSTRKLDSIDKSFKVLNFNRELLNIYY